VTDLDEQYLTAYAKTFLERHYNVKLTIPVVRNNRLRTSLGRFVVSANGTPLRIELSGNVLTYGAESVILGVLRHECIHYAFFKRGIFDTDGDPLFERALRKHRAPSSRTLKVGRFFRFQCVRCGSIGETTVKRVRQNPTSYLSKCCQANIELIGEKVYDGLT